MTIDWIENQIGIIIVIILCWKFESLRVIAFLITIKCLFFCFKTFCRRRIFDQPDLESLRLSSSPSSMSPMSLANSRILSTISSCTRLMLMARMARPISK